MGMMGIPAEQARAIRERQMSHDLYRSGLDHYSGEYDEAAMSQWVNQMAGQPTTSPWINVTDDSRQSTYNAFMEDNYNPFIGNEGAWVTPEGNDLRGSNNGTAEGYRDDSISAYLKNAFAGQDQVQNRANAIRDFKEWNGTERGINPVSTQMNQQFFDEMGLAEKYGLSFENRTGIKQWTRNPFIGDNGGWINPEGDGLRWTPNGPSGRYRDESIAGWFKEQFSGEDQIDQQDAAVLALKEWRDKNENADGSPFNTTYTRMNQRYFDEMDLGNKFGLTYVDPRQAVYDEIAAGFSSPISGNTGGFMDAYSGSQPTAGGFMESYLKKKAETKPSVMSLMTELKDA